MSLSATVRTMAQAGCTPEQIAAVVEAFERAELEKKDAKRAKDAERKRRSRHAESRDVTRTSEDSADKVSPSALPPFSPPTPPPISPNPPTPSKKNRDFAEAMARFWEAYPRRVGKNAAERALAKAMLETDIETILAGVAKYRVGKPDYADWAHPSSWLNAGRWADEYGDPAAPVSPELQAVPQNMTEQEFEAWWAARHANTGAA